MRARKPTKGRGRKMRSPRLLAAYRDTRFLVFTPASTLVLRVDRKAPALDALLDGAGERSWAYLTAFRSRSRVDRNLRANEKLRRQLGLDHRHVLPGCGLAATQDHCEPSFLVLGMTRAAAVGVGEAYRQDCVLVGSRGGAAELADCRAKRA